MKFNKEKDEAELSTGRKISMFMGLLSPGADGQLYNGSDGPVSETWEYDDDGNGGRSTLTPEERREIAEYMIAQWASWCGAESFAVDGCSFWFAKNPTLRDDGHVVFKPDTAKTPYCDACKQFHLPGRCLTKDT